MNKIRYLLSTGPLLAFLCLNSNLYAGSCATVSPNIQLSNNMWAEIKPQKLTQEEVAKLFAFFKGLDGRWKGDGHFTECKTRGKKIYEKLQQQIVNMKIARSSEHRYNITADIYDTGQKKHTNYKFIIYKKDNLINIKGEGDIEFASLSSEGISFRTQTLLNIQRHSGGKSTQTRISQESVRIFELAGGQLHFSIADFHNGAMISYSEWQLAKE